LIHPFKYRHVRENRAIHLATTRARPADLNRWTTVRDMVYRQIMDRGWDTERAAFVQHYRTNVLDAALLYMPLVGFIAPRDPMWASTLKAMDDELVSDSLVYRYDPAASPDGLRGSEGTFSICTFWYVDALARSGRLNDDHLIPVVPAITCRSPEAVASGRNQHLHRLAWSYEFCGGAVEGQVAGAIRCHTNGYAARRWRRRGRPVLSGNW
jgi:hypothetical protein